MRQLNPLDFMICSIDDAIRTVWTPASRYRLRETPGKALSDKVTLSKDKRHVAGLMRVNHSGEVCAQALYQGQALTAQLTHVRHHMEQAAAEENDHLAWCEERLQELNSSPSFLNPLWYGGSLLLGVLAGLAGDQWSLGFVMETERQVTEHLQRHLLDLPQDDHKTRAIITQMEEDEACHAKTARDAGAHELPLIVKQIMHCVAKVMTSSSYYL